MSECCLPNLGCLSIPVVSTNVAGNPGQNGAPGAAATIAVGTVTTVNPGDPATVTNVGTSGAAIFDFEIPEGAAGAAGVDGTTRLYTNRFLGTGTSIVPSSWEVMDTYTLAANSLVNVGDAIIIQFEADLLAANTTAIIAGRSTIVQPRRRVSIASGVTSLTQFDVTNALAEPYMITVSNVTANQTYSYRTTVELVKISSGNISNNFISRVRWDYTIPSMTYSNNRVNPFSINTANPIVFSFDIYQYQATEIKMRMLTIDKITAVAP